MCLVFIKGEAGWIRLRFLVAGCGISLKSKKRETINSKPRISVLTVFSSTRSKIFARDSEHSRSEERLLAKVNMNYFASFQN